MSFTAKILEYACSDSLRLGLCFFLSALIYVLAQRLDRALALKGAMREAEPPERGAPRLAGDLIACLAGLAASALFLLLSARPVMSLLLAAALITLLLVLNRAKEQVLREPLVLADAWLLRQIFRYPEMYFPFLPMKAIALGLLGLAACLALLVLAESPVPALRSACGISLLLLLFAAPILALILMRHGRLQSLARFLLRRCPVSHEAARDARDNGALAAALLHPVWAGLSEKEHTKDILDFRVRPAASKWPPAFERTLLQIPQLPLERRPHCILVQAESFCDIREQLPEAQASALKHFLPNWDALKARGQSLPTPKDAFGAYTMRTEFSMLTGLGQKDLGPFAFNPYLLAGKRPLWSLARHLADAGYETLCVHPYHKNFFRRDRVMKNLGFERFLDIADLSALERFGPYTSDLALGRHIRRELSRAAGPVFVFVISMEAHGPWPDERLTDEEIAQCLPDLDRRPFSRQTLIYLCHLRHMDMLFGLLQEPCADKGGRERESLLWPYGDHAPGLAIFS
ncbi:LTA synthase family protein [Desulfovibrio sp. OttesenSCG-928-A18]|nr:LTA synthase family protein [Desulfovibrio sp. OttesenSCG-928-A18]